MLEIILRLVAGAFLTLANAFFVVTEFSLTRLRQFDSEEFRDDPGLERAWEMTERLEIYLTGCQLGITSSSILLGVVAEPAVTQLIRPGVEALGTSESATPAISVVLAVVVINLIHKIWGEQAPTYLGVERPKEVARHAATTLFWWTRIMYPAIYLGDGLAKLTLRLFGVEIERSWTQAEEGAPDSDHDDHQELEPRRAINEILARSRLPEDRRREVIAALEIDHKTVADIMVPREEIVALKAESSFAGHLESLSRGSFSRLPMIGDSVDDFRGILYVPSLFHRFDELQSGELDLAELVAPPLTVPADCPVSHLIDRFQDASQELALVVDDDGRVQGLVTTTDAFEAIAGELEDPFD